MDVGVQDASAAPCKGLRIDAWRRYGRLSHNAIITANAISYPDEPGLEKNRVRFTSSEFLKSSRKNLRRSGTRSAWR
jgi:hypothetical protein